MCFYLLLLHYRTAYLFPGNCKWSRSLHANHSLLYVVHIYTPCDIYNRKVTVSLTFRQSCLYQKKEIWSRFEEVVGNNVKRRPNVANDAINPMITTQSTRMSSEVARSGITLTTDQEMRCMRTAVR